jgi:hypothetical protein
MDRTQNPTAGRAMPAAAARLAARDFRVFPLLAGQKRPAAEGWKDTPKRSFIDVLESFPEAANIGIATGDDYTVIDADAAKGGLESLAALDLPETLTIETWSGGRHLYFRTPRGQPVANSVEKLAKGIDVRGAGGLVVGPGSVVEGKPYRIIRDVPIAELPRHIVERCHAARVRHEDAGKLADGVDAEGSHAGNDRARHYVVGAAPSAEQGKRDNTATVVAMRIYDFTPSRDVCRELLELWNETKCSPPLGEEDLDRIADSSRRSKGSALGRDDPLRHFAIVEDPPPPGAAQPGSASIDSYIEPLTLRPGGAEAIPPRPWLAENRLLRGHVTQLIAPGGAGKSLLSLQWAVAVAMGDGRFTGLDVRERAKTLIINLEDDREEQQRRLEAISAVHGVALDTIGEWLFAYRGSPDGDDDGDDGAGRFCVLKRNDRKLSPTSQVRQLTRYIQTNRIGFVIVDPLVETHEADENDNTAMAKVAAIYRGIARRTGAAVLLIHHTKKPPQADAEGFAGNVDAGRGASAMGNSGRVALTLFSMTKKEAQRNKIAEGERFRYARLDDAKANYGLLSATAQWFERVSHALPNGDSVGALRPKAFLIDPHEQKLLRLVFAAVKDSQERKLEYTVKDRGGAGAAFELRKLEPFAPYSREAIKSALKSLEDEGAIKKEDRGGDNKKKAKVPVWRVVPGGRDWFVH